jgi:Outer membrane protein beta-barrel domain
MNTCRNSALAIFLLVSLTDLHAQIKPGYIFGLNLSTVTLKAKGVSSGPSMPAGIHFGGFLDAPLNDNFSLEPALLLSAKGSNFKIDTVEYSLAPVYLEIPIMAVYSFGSDIVKVSLLAGPYFACGIGGYKIKSEGGFNYLNFGSGGNNDLKPFDFGLNFGAGINIKGFRITAQYGIGLVNILPSATVDAEMKNKVIGISISSLFEAK